jgi:hypothetical protein
VELCNKDYFGLWRRGQADGGGLRGSGQAAMRKENAAAAGTIIFDWETG